VSDLPEPPRRPAPTLTAESEFFWQAAAQGLLVGQACNACQRLRHPPRPMCPNCGSLDWTVVPLSGRGTIYSFSIIHHPQNPAFDYPVLAALIDLDEGIRIVSNIVDCEPKDLSIGRRVAVRFAPTAREMAVPVFSLEQEEDR
jgi:uncharacterized OB-fold protein